MSCKKVMHLEIAKDKNEIYIVHLPIPFKKKGAEFEGNWIKEERENLFFHK